MMAKWGVRTALSAGCAGLLVGAPAAPAQRTVISGTASVRYGAASNPFLERAGSASLYGEIDLSPRLELQTPTSLTVAAASYRRTQYVDDYSGSNALEASISHERQASERVRLSFDGEFTSALIGQSEVGLEGAPPNSTQVDPDLLDPQLGLFGGQQRRKRFGLNASVDLQLDETSTLRHSSFGTRADYSGGGVGQSYWSYGGTLDYSRRLGPRARGGARLSYSWTDYDSTLGTNALVLQPQVHYGRQVSQWMNVDVSIGAVIVEERFAGAKRVTTNVGGSLQSCIGFDRSSICANATRDAAATGLGSVRISTGLGLTYANRLGEYDQLRVGAQYSRVGADDRPIANRPAQRASSLVSIFGSAETRIARRLILGANANYRRLADAVGTDLTDINGQIFLRVMFGPAQ